MKILLIALQLIVLSASAQNYAILYTNQVNNNDNLFVIDQSGEKRQITNHSRKDSSPMMSPDGSKIIFTSERVGWWKIWMMDVVSKKVKQLTYSGSAEYSPSWSPDGQRILFVSGRNVGSDIYTMNLNGKDMNQLTSNKNCIMPSWGADNKIYYSAKTSGTYQVWQMDIDGSNKVQISKGNGDKMMPQISSIGSMILYYGNAHGNMEIYTMRPDGTDVNKLTTDELMDIRPRWSADSKMIVFERGNKRNNQQIYIMNADGSEQKQITQSGYNYAPSFTVNESKYFE